MGVGPDRRRLLALAAALFLGAAALAIGYLLFVIGPHPIDWYRLDAPDLLTVDVTTGPVAWTWVSDVTETPTRVTITVKSFDLALGPGSAVGYPRQLSVHLQQPLGSRPVYDGTGLQVPRYHPPEPAPTPTPVPSGGISRERAIELATAHSSARTFVAAEAGHFGDLTFLGPGSAIAADRWVWVVTFAGEVSVCPPAALPSAGPTPTPAVCSSPSEGKTTVMLDYFSGEFLSAESMSAVVPTVGPAGSVGP